MDNNLVACPVSKWVCPLHIDYALALDKGIVWRRDCECGNCCQLLQDSNFLKCLCLHLLALSERHSWENIISKTSETEHKLIHAQTCNVHTWNFAEGLHEDKSFHLHWDWSKLVISAIISSSRNSWRLLPQAGPICSDFYCAVWNAEINFIK